MARFKIGDRVIITRVQSRRHGEHGTICCTPNSMRSSYGVRLDKPIGESDCDGTCEYNHGWNIMEEYMDFENKNEDVQQEYQIGDHVIRISKGVHSWSDDGPRIGATGIVCGTYYYENNQLTYAVDWDEKIDGHDCYGSVKSHNGFWVFPDEIELFEELPAIDILEILEV